ncbi:acyltransferase [Nostoc sp. UHCC 0302]|uniref:acyltransferase n=1 Tax=Nostoc sp. UHCC 0302 TaxID=3134896 RepID=UPI00311CC3B8
MNHNGTVNRLQPIMLAKWASQLKIFNILEELYWLIFNFLSKVHHALLIRKRIKSFKSCGEVGSISPLSCIVHEAGLELGNRVCIGEFTHIVANGGVRIGDGTLIASHCSITTITHPINCANRFDAPTILKPIEIGKNVWIGTGAVILPGIRIGDNSVIGAGAIVTKDVPANCVYIRNPARYLKNLTAEK